TPGIARCWAELFLDAKQLVVLVDAFAAGGRAGLDLAGIGAHRQVSDRGVFGFARTMRDDRSEARRAGHFDRVERLGDAANLIDFDQDGIRRPLSDTPAQAFGIGHEQVVADELHAVTETRGELTPTLPIVL